MFFFKKLAVLTFIEIGYLGSVRTLILRMRGRVDCACANLVPADNNLVPIGQKYFATSEGGAWCLQFWESFLISSSIGYDVKGLITGDKYRGLRKRDGAATRVRRSSRSHHRQNELDILLFAFTTLIYFLKCKLTRFFRIHAFHIYNNSCSPISKSRTI